MTKHEAWELVLVAAQEAAEILANDLDSESAARADAIYEAIKLLTDGHEGPAQSEHALTPQEQVEVIEQQCADAFYPQE